MWLEIKWAKFCRGGSYGHFIVTGKERARITLSAQKNRTFADYATTLLHELLHCYTVLLRVKGFRVSGKKEHEWIYACEKAVIELMRKRLKRRRA